MRMKAAFLLFIVVSGLILACTKTEIVISKNDLAGTWKLARITGGFAGIDSTPADRITLTFDAQGNFSSKLNVTITSSGTYNILKAADPADYGSETLLNLHSDNNALTYGMHLSNDSLFLGSGCCDQFGYTYIKQK